MQPLITEIHREYCEPIKPSLKPVAYGPGLLETLKNLEHRVWFVKNILLKGYVSALFAPGGVGKSMMQLSMAVSIASGRDILNVGRVQRAKVLIINNEDDESEFQRRLGACLLHHNIVESEIDRYLEHSSGYGQPFKIAAQLDRDFFPAWGYDALRAYIKETGAEVIFIDPFISTHNTEENNNTDIDKVVELYKAIAYELKVHINIIHHTKKSGSDSESHAGDPEAGRGASSLKDAARTVVTLSAMNTKSAKDYGVPDEYRYQYFRLDLGKNNYASNHDNVIWFRRVSVTLPNGEDNVAIQQIELERIANEKEIAKSPAFIARALYSIVGEDTTVVLWSKIKHEFMDVMGLGSSAATERLKLIPTEDSKTPLTLKVGASMISLFRKRAKKNFAHELHFIKLDS